MIGYALTASHCTLRRSLDVLKRLVESGEEVVPFLSERAASTDTRFIRASELVERVEKLTGRRAVRCVVDAEPYGPHPLEALIIAPCTGNTLAKIASGITDGCVTMAAKAHLRCDTPLLIALASNDAMSQNLKNIASLLTRRSVYMLPMRQDDPAAKPYSLVAELERIPEALAAMREGRALRPLFT